jgi:hypothetical protein
VPTSWLLTKMLNHIALQHHLMDKLVKHVACPVCDTFTTDAFSENHQYNKCITRTL